MLIIADAILITDEINENIKTWLSKERTDVKWLRAIDFDEVVADADASFRFEIFTPLAHEVFTLSTYRYPLISTENHQCVTIDVSRLGDGDYNELDLHLVTSADNDILIINVDECLDGSDPTLGIAFDGNSKYLKNMLDDVGIDIGAMFADSLRE